MEKKIFTDDEFKRLKAQDSVVFEKLYKLYKNKVYTFISIKTGFDRSIIYEIVSDTFFSAYKSLPNLKKNKSLYSWLLRIASRRYHDYIRKLYRQEKYNRLYETKKEPHQLVDETLENILREEKKFLIRSALDNVKKDYREVLEMKYIKDKSQKEIAESVGKSIKAVEGLLFKGRKALKKEMLKLSKDLLAT